MADDPRQVFRSEDMPPYPWSTMGGTQAPDPLRALLADEDRAVDLIANAIYGVDGNAGPAPLRYALPVLAALREVADTQNGPDQLAADQGHP